VATNDHGARSKIISATEVIDVDGLLVYVIHDFKELDLDPAAAGTTVGILIRGGFPVRCW
jgi:hypothetical protein